MRPFIGQSIPRREDERLTTGKGRYTSDLIPRDAAHVAFVRAPIAHARIIAIRTDAARAMPGVLAVLTAHDYATDGHGPIAQLPNPADAIEWQRPAFQSGEGDRPVIETPHPPLALDVVRYIGEAVALVVAETSGAARDAAELVEIDFDDLPVVVRAADAIAPGAPQLHAEVPDNLAFDLTYGDSERVDRALAGAAHIIERTFTNQRIIAAHMEPRSAFASYDAQAGSYTITAGGQGVMRHRLAAAGALRVPPDRVRYISPDVGGGFGARNNIHVEPVLVAWAARRTGRTAAWVSDRSEGFLTDYHARDIVTRLTMGLAHDGTILATRFDNLGNCGAYTVSFASFQNVVRIATGPYHVPAADVRIRAVLTNTTPTGPYRGAGRPEIVYAFERMLDIAADELGLDRVEIRRKNLIALDQLPYRTQLGLIYDAGDFVANMDRVVERSDWYGFGARKARSEANGKLRGRGIANYIESPVGAPRERVVVTIGAERVDIVSGTLSNGQGHETTFAQIAGDLLQVPMESIDVRTGDTAFVTGGGGTHSNRSIRLVGTLLVETCGAIVETAKQHVAEKWNVAVADIAETDGIYHVAGSDRAMTFFAIAAERAAAGTPLAASGDIARRIPAFPTGAAVCEVEIDPQLGSVIVERYTSIDDAGRIINPMIVDGQTHGGIAQGIGQALYEAIGYDPATGQPSGATFMGYAMPRAHHVPNYDLELAEHRTLGNPLSLKGGGEAGITPSPAIVINALCDALHDYGVDDLPMPATAEIIWTCIRAGKRAPRPAKELAGAEWTR